MSELQRLTPNQHTIMSYLDEELEEGYLASFQDMAGVTHLTTSTAKRAVRQLAKLGLTRCATAHREDSGKFAGSGYCLTQEGRNWLKAWKQTPEYKGAYQYALDKLNALA